MTMRVLSRELVSHTYRQQLQQDLSRATICRFMVAYVSDEGLDALHRHLVTRVLRHPRSFGIASLTCSCGYEPLLSLQSATLELPLKYFMDPKVQDTAEPSELALFHSKIVYLVMERERKAVAYLGSHNWSRRALGPTGPRNAEASLRLELDFDPADLEGEGSSVGSDINRHLMDAWNFPMCVPAIEPNRQTFEEWFAKGCRRAMSTQLQDATIVLTVRRSSSIAPTSNNWLNLTGRGIYLQALEEADGQTVWKCSDRLLVFVWDSDAALANAEQPIILQCGVTTYNASPGSAMAATNQSDNPVKGFEAAIVDRSELDRRRGTGAGMRGIVPLWSGRNVEIFDFEFPPLSDDSVVVDAGVMPKYRFHLEVQRVVFPACGPLPEEPAMLWEPESFAVAASKSSAKFEDKPGYYVEAKLRDEMLTSLKTVLNIEPRDAKVLPFSERDRAKAGKRISRHPLHETYLCAMKLRRSESKFYEKLPLGALAADLESIDEIPLGLARESEMEPLRRAQRVFTMPFSDLFELWEDLAKKWQLKRTPPA
jgi:hypothetical protein